jgi:F0F1-type ATP synthase assembly protein I
MQLSWTLLFSLLLPLLVGIWLDKRFDTVPLFILIGTVLGILAATVGVARMAVRTFGHTTAGEDAKQTRDHGEEEPE